MAKVLTGAISTRLANVYNDYVGNEQFGCVKGRGTMIANMMTRAVVEAARVQELSCAVLFVDLSKAFDFAIREVLLGWPADVQDKDRESKIELLVARGLAEKYAGNMVEYIDASGGIIRELGVGPDIHALLAGMHQGAWFRMDGPEADFILTARGGRQGCRLGGLVFNMIYARALRRMREKLAEKGVTNKLAFRAAAPFWANPGSKVLGKNEAGTPEDDVAELCDTTFVDDEAVYLVNASPIQLCLDLGTVLDVVETTFAESGFQINWAAGKTEVMIKLRGARAGKARERTIKIFQGSPVIQMSAERAVHVVDSYKHVGGIVATDGHMRREVCARVQAATAAWVKMRKVITDHHLPTDVRLQLLRGLVLSRLFFQSPSWSELDGWCMHKLEATYAGYLRQLSGNTWNEAKKGAKYKSDLDVRLWLGMPSVACILQKARLRALPSIMACPVRALLALIAVRAPRDEAQTWWARTMAADLAQLSAVADLAFLGDPVEHAVVWAKFAAENTSEWAKQVSALETSRGIQPYTGEPRSPSVGALRCETCQATGFRTQKAVDMHRRVVHGLRQMANRFVDSNSCPVCKKLFANRLRVISHLSETRQRGKGLRGPSCRDRVLAGEVPQIPESRLMELDLQARAERFEARRAGHTRPVVGDLGSAAKRPLDILVEVPSRRVRQKTAEREITGKRLAKKPRVS